MSGKKQKKVIAIGDNLDEGRQINALMDSRYIQILVFLIITAFFLRLYNLGFNSLWLDEATTSMLSVKSFGDIWQIVATGEFNPPLFYWLEHIVIMAFGNGEFALRMFPAIFGIAIIPVVYLIGVEFKDKNVGIIMASLFTFSPFLIIYSQEARAYSMMLFFIACAMLFYFKSLKSNDIKNWVIFGFFSALAFWSHFYAFVMIASCMIYALMVNLKDIKQDINYIKPFIISLITFIGLSLPLIIVTIELFGKRTSSAPTYGIQGFNIIYDTFVQVSGYNELVMALFLLLFIIGIIFSDKQKSKFFIWFILSIFIVSYFLSFKIPMIPRYLQFLPLILFLGIALSYKALFVIFQTKKVIYGMVVLFMIISMPFLIGYYSQESKTDWRGFSGSLQKLTKQGDYVVFVPGYLQTPTEYYYSNKTNGVIFISAYTGKDLDSIQKNNNSLFYVMTGDVMATDPTGSARDWVFKNTKLIAQYNDIYLSVR